MKKIPAENIKLLKELNTKLEKLQTDLVQVNKLEGKDPNVTIKIKKNQARFERVRKKNQEDKALGKFYLEIEVTSKQRDVFIPLSVASGKKVSGFMYQIEGTAEGSIVTTDIKVRGEGVTQVTVGTLLYARIPVGKIALFALQATIRGKFSKKYKIVFTRINYKLNLTDVRYEQYLKELSSDSVTFS